MLRRISLLLAAFALSVVVTPRPAQAKPELLRLWFDVHGTIASGQGRYFNLKNGPYAGYGFSTGLQLIVFEAFFDVNVFDTGRAANENHPTMFNMLGGGLQVPFRAHENVRIFARANVAYTFAPYDSDLEATGDNNGYVIRGGGGVDYKPNQFVAIGAAGYGGYHVFGTRSGGDNGSHMMVQLYTRFDLGF